MKLDKCRGFRMEIGFPPWFLLFTAFNRLTVCIFDFPGFIISNRPSLERQLCRLIFGLRAFELADLRTIAHNPPDTAASGNAFWLMIMSAT